MNDMIILAKKEIDNLRKFTSVGINLIQHHMKEGSLSLPHVKDSPSFTLIETIKVNHLALKDEGNDDFSIMSTQYSAVSYKLTQMKTKDKVEWMEAINDALETSTLNTMIDENIQNNSTDFQIIQAKYGRLQGADTYIDILPILRQIVQDQGDRQLLLNSGSKESIFGIPKKTKQRQIMIVYSLSGNIQSDVFHDTDAIRIGKVTVPNSSYFF